MSLESAFMLLFSWGISAWHVEMRLKHPFCLQVDLLSMQLVFLSALTRPTLIRWHTLTHSHPLLLYTEKHWAHHSVPQPAEAGCHSGTSLQSHRFQKQQDALLHSNNSHSDLNVPALIIISMSVLHQAAFRFFMFEGYGTGGNGSDISESILLPYGISLQLKTKVHQLSREAVWFDGKWGGSDFRNLGWF